MRDETPSFSRRWLSTWSAKAAAAILCAWVTVALCAPFLANDKPYWMRATDFGSYENARTSLVTVTQAWLDIEALGEDEWRAGRKHASAQTYAEAVDLERRALDLRIQVLGSALDPAEDDARAALDRFEAACRAPKSSRNSVVLVALARSNAEALRPERSHEYGGGVYLAVSNSTPLCASVSALNGGAAAAWLVFLGALVAVRSMRARCVLAALVFVIVGALWRPVFGSDVGPASVKQSMMRGDLIVGRAVFPPIAMGFAETHMREAFRSPFEVTGGTFVIDRFGDSARVPPVSSALPFEPVDGSPWRHPLGTDSLGRDLLARLLWGARISLFVGNASAVLLTLIGIALGLLAGWRGGWSDFAISRAIEVVVCFPAFVLVLCALFFVDPASAPPLLAVAVVIGIVGWTSVARLVRAEVLRVRELDFVTAARALGLSESAILRRHVLPNVIQPAIIAFAFAVGAGVLTESALSFLGFGVQVPVPSWGALVSDSKSPDHAWIWLVPGFAIFTVVASYNILGEALRDALDPRHER